MRGQRGFLSALSEASAVQVSIWEWTSLTCGVLYALLAVRRSRFCWVAGAASSAIIVPLAWSRSLPAQAVLQAFYVLVSIYGFWRWSSQAQGHGLRITVWPWSRHALCIAAITACSMLFAGPLAQFSGAAWPRLDTAVMLGSLLATFMVALGKLENWLYWIVIDLLSLFLFGAQKLWGLALLYAAYAGIAAVGFHVWRRQYRGAAAA
jgi:nicotinamide mononucleotide transporter